MLLGYRLTADLLRQLTCNIHCRYKVVKLHRKLYCIYHHVSVCVSLYVCTRVSIHLCVCTTVSVYMCVVVCVYVSLATLL